MHRRVALVALSALPMIASAQTTTPEAFLRSIYDSYLKADFKGQPYRQPGQFFVPDLAEAIEADMREAKRRGEVPKLNGDPFVDAQEWEIKDLLIAVDTAGPTTIGRVSFTNLDKRSEVALDLRQTPAGLRIADIKAPSGSLRALLQIR